MYFESFCDDEGMLVAFPFEQGIGSNCHRELNIICQLWVKTMSMGMAKTHTNLVHLENLIAQDQGTCNHL